jgi:AbiU2
MPEPLKSRWEALDEETNWLHGRWKIYRQLFGTSPERVEVLNESAGAFFYIIQTVLMNDVELTLSKFADAARTSGRHNLTLESLVKDVSQFDATLCKELNGMLVDYRRLCQKVIHRRHKQLAHFDLATLMAEKSTPIPGASRQEIEDALRALRMFMNALQRKFTDAETAYGEIVLTTDGDQLLSVLQRGLRYQELAAAGAVDWDDLRQHSKYFGI